ncbi:MAG: hypothetical protein U0892_17190 [Pirellulales bacterium]
MPEVKKPAGLNFSYFNGESGLKHLIEAMGGGIGVIDFDLDGHADCYFPQSRIPNDRIRPNAGSIAETLSTVPDTSMSARELASLSLAIRSAWQSVM